jgi:dethiobiotin synthetase
VTRPARLFLVTGSGTEVGKTWVAARLLEELRRRGHTVSARKPAQSNSPGEPTDAEILAGVTGETSEGVCPAPRTYAVALAPPMAARVLGRPPPTLDDLVGELDRSWPAEVVDIGVVEGAGGVCSPLAIDGDSADLARRVRADGVILVGEPQLGIVNAARLSRRALHPLPITVHLNRFEPDSDLHRINRDWLVDQDGFEVTTSVEALADTVAVAAGAAGTASGSGAVGPTSPGSG